MKKALVIGYIWPEPKTTAAGNRMLQLLHGFLEYDYHIVFATTASKTQYSEDLVHLGIQEQPIALNDSSFDVFVQGLNPDVVLFDRFMVEEQFGWRVAEFVPKALRILNTEDLHSLRKTRQLVHRKGEEFTISHWLQHDMTKREIASLYRSDLTLLVSHYEKKLLEEELHIPAVLVYHLPFLLEAITEKDRKAFPVFEKRKDFSCFGNGRHAPNIDALKYLNDAIWPLIRKELPEAKLHVYGAYLPQQIQELHRPQKGFLVHGWVEDLDTELQKTRINLAPLRFGAGIKGKLTRAMQNGTPSVTTAIGAEGMYDAMDWAGEITEKPNDFVQKAVDLYENEQKWHKKQQNGLDIINGLYSKGKLLPAFFKVLENLRTNIVEQRTKNFVGQLLQQQSMASTKYMAKWIEEKNRKK